MIARTNETVGVARGRRTVWQPWRFALAAWLLLLGALGAVGAPQPAEAPPEEASPEAGPPPILHIVVDSPIHPVAAEFIAESLDHADEIGATALVLELNTPGGLLTSTRDITKSILTARTPVVVYVAPSGAQAASAGFFILMSSDVAAMAPGTNTGAAHPVGGQGEDIEGDMGAKVEQDAAATIRSLAGQHGRNVELAEAAVIESRSFAADEALEEGLIDLIAPTVPKLVEALDGREIAKLGEAARVLSTADARIVRREMRPFQRFLGVLNHPEIAYLLMALGFLGLYMELSNPGTILPGVIGAICVILAFYSLSVLPLNYAGVALILLALIFLVAEIYTPTYGILTVAGVIALILGSIMLFKDVDPAMRVGLEVILGTVGTIVVVMLVLLTRALQVRRGKVKTGAEGLVGERGVARSDLDPRGRVFVHGEVWTAEAASPVTKGQPVEVEAIEGLKLRVRGLDDAATEIPSQEGE